MDPTSTQASADKSIKPPTLLGMPAEIRNLIYESLFESNNFRTCTSIVRDIETPDSIGLSNQESQLRRTGTNLMAVNRQLHKELSLLVQDRTGCAGLWFINSVTKLLHTKEHMRSEVTKFLSTIPSDNNIVHIDIGGEDLLPQLPARLQENLTREESRKRLFQWLDGFHSQPYRGDNFFSKGELIVELLKRLAPALPKVRSITFHDDVELFWAQYGHKVEREIARAFPKVEEMHIIRCHPHFVARMSRVRRVNGDIEFECSGDDSQTVAEKLMDTKYYID